MKDITCSLGEQREGPVSLKNIDCHKYKKGSKKCDVSCDDYGVALIELGGQLTSSGTLGVL